MCLPINYDRRVAADSIWTEMIQQTTPKRYTQHNEVCEYRLTPRHEAVLVISETAFSFSHLTAWQQKNNT